MKKNTRKKVIGASVLAVGLAVGTITISSLYGPSVSDFSNFFATADTQVEREQVASFSFDGAKANTLFLEEKYVGSKWSYSLDGGTNWIDATKDEVVLSEAELGNITEANDILVRVLGETDTYRIDITSGKNPEGLFANDKENKIIGDKRNYEWKLEGDEAWTKFSTKSPVLSGKKTLKVRSFSKGTELAGSAVIYNFTEDTIDDNKTYVPVSNISVKSATKMEGAKNTVDANVNTSWVVDAKNAELVLSLSQAMYISKIDFLGNVQSIELSVSEDAKEWTSVATLGDIENTDERVSIELEEPVEAKYVKFAVISRDDKVSISDIEFYHDKTKTGGLVLDLDYDVTALTNGNVVVQLLRPEGVTITNNSGSDKYTFTKNGEFTFEFRDSSFKTGVAVAKVDWIDKTVPTATIKYSSTELTNQDVIATVSFNEAVEVKTVDEKLVRNEDGTYSMTFTENGSFELEYVDMAGNTGKSKLEVSCIDKKAPAARVEFKNESEFGPVIATLILDEEGTVINNDGKYEYIFEDNGTFVFEYRDLAGNTGSIKATVDWIKPHAKVDVKYSTMENTTGEVTATLVADKVITITNNGGSSTFTFKENGEFTYTYVDEFGNNGVVVAKVSWIVKPNTGGQSNTGSTDSQKPVSKPSTSGTKKPSTTSPSTNKPSVSTTDKKDDVTVPADEYKNYSVGSVGVKVPADAITETVNLFSKSLSLDEVKDECGSESEYMELYLENEKNQVYYLKNKTVTIRFKLDDQKDFKGVYQVSDDGHLVKLDYGNESGNSISVKTNSLGKYLLSYDQKESTVPTPVKKAAIKSFNFMVIVIVAVIVILAGVAFVIIKNKKSANREVENDFYNDDQF